jgi:putative IMPACT (imprinted ancient) family translation regulator
MAERFDDDGEPSGCAGRPILHHLKGASVCDGIVVVTRWFGGTRLGTGGLVQAYSESAHLALEAAGRIHVHQQVPLRLVLDYEDLGAVEAVLARRREWVWQVERDFGDSPAFLVHSRQSCADPLRAELTEQLSGRIRIETLPVKFVEG